MPSLWLFFRCYQARFGAEPGLKIMRKSSPTKARDSSIISPVNDTQIEFFRHKIPSFFNNFRAVEAACSRRAILSDYRYNRGPKFTLKPILPMRIEGLY